MRFSGGSEPCVHRDPGADGWLGCLSRCRVDPTHSLPQHALLGAKPNHGFSRCQHPHATFFRRGARPRTRHRPRPASGDGMRDDDNATRACGACKKTSGKHAYFFARMAEGDSRGRDGRGRRRTFRERARLERHLKKSSAKGSGFRVAQARMRRFAQKISRRARLASRFAQPFRTPFRVAARAVDDARGTHASRRADRSSVAGATAREGRRQSPTHCRRLLELTRAMRGRWRRDGSEADAAAATRWWRRPRKRRAARRNARAPPAREAGAHAGAGNETGNRRRRNRRPPQPVPRCMPAWPAGLRACYAR